MKKLNPFFKHFSWLVLDEVSAIENNQREIVDFQLSYYEDIFIRELSAKTVREAMNAVDLIILHERDTQYYSEWPRMTELYRVCVDYLKANTALFEDPIFGQGRYEEQRIHARYEHNKRVLTAYAERHGLVVV